MSYIANTFPINTKAENFQFSHDRTFKRQSARKSVLRKFISQIFEPTTAHTGQFKRFFFDWLTISQKVEIPVALAFRQTVVQKYDSGQARNTLLVQQEFVQCVLFLVWQFSLPNCPTLSKQPGLSLPKGNFCNSYSASLFTFSMYLVPITLPMAAILMTIDSFFSLQLYQSVLNRTLLILGVSEVDPHI